MGYDSRHEIPVHCPNCAEDFTVPKSMKGGHANCPGCRQAVPVVGGYEAEFWILFGLGAVFVLGISLGLGFAVHPAAGIVTFLIGAVIMGIVIAVS